MLRQVLIFKDGEIIYQQTFGKSIDEVSFQGVMKNIEKEATKSSGEKVHYYDFYRYRISYISEKNKNIIFLFVSDLSDKFESIESGLNKTKKEFLLMFEGVLDHRFDRQTFDIFDPTIESIHKALRPKISLVGFSGVGKTTITNLIQAKEIPTEHIPTITGDIATIRIGNLHFHLWDFAGQEQFSFLWNNFIKGSDAVILITDSTLENCEKSRYFIDLIHKEVPYAHQAVIGNKQDLPDAMPVADIERILNLKTYSMVATDSNNRNKMITIIADVLEMSSEVSPLLKPLIERDRKITEAEQALEAGDIQTAVKSFNEVADLCIKLGDDVLSQEFHEKANKFKKILQSVEIQYEKTPKVQMAETINKEVNNNSLTEESEKEVVPNLDEQNNISLQRIETENLPESQVTLQTEPQMKEQSTSVKTPIEEKSNHNLKSESIIASMKSGRSIVQSTDAEDGTQMNQKSIAASKSNKLNQMSISVETPNELNKSQSNADLSSTQNTDDFLKPIINQNLFKTQKIAPDVSTSNERKSDSSSNPKSDAEQKIKINRDIVDLRIKLTNISKTLTDLEMDNIMGTLSDEDYERKTSRLKTIEQNITSQIEELKKYLD